MPSRVSRPKGRRLRGADDRIAVPRRIIERGVRTGGRFVLATTAASYLETLNPEQRRAVEHGVSGNNHVGPPLLVIAGAGSGKTNTLAHHVAHLIVSGADPRRILLMTFSRRAASEMSKRVERIARKVLGANAGIVTDALSWAGSDAGRRTCGAVSQAAGIRNPSQLRTLARWSASAPVGLQETRATAPVPR